MSNVVNIKVKQSALFVSCACIIFLLASCSELGAKKNQGSSTSKKPNFLFVLVDDQPFDALGLSGRYPFLETPNMDRLANEGVNVKNFFVTQSICSPSRASFLTGTYPTLIFMA